MAVVHQIGGLCKKPQERTKAIVEEILIDAEDATRSEALKVWRQLGTNPQKFVPLTEAVLALIQQAHPNFFLRSWEEIPGPTISVLTVLPL